VAGTIGQTPGAATASVPCAPVAREIVCRDLTIRLALTRLLRPTDGFAPAVIPAPPAVPVPRPVGGRGGWGYALLLHPAVWEAAATVTPGALEAPRRKVCRAVVLALS